jgi:hypothetical protein
VFGEGHLTKTQARIRSDSLIWPIATALLSIGGIFLLAAISRTGGKSGVNAGHIATKFQRILRMDIGRFILFLFLAMETAFLIAAGAPLWSSSPQGAVVTPGVAALKAAVGDSTVGFGPPQCLAGPPTGLGVYPNANIFYGIHEFFAYDPALPGEYLSAWTAASGQAGGVPLLGEFCPAINSVKLARQFGVSFVLEPAGSHGPSGSILDGIFDNEDLYKIPGAGAANLVGLNAPADSTGKVVKVDHPSPSSWRVVTSGSTPQLLRLHLTRLPGWHATIDGRPLSLKPFSGVMMEAQVPRGRHVVELTYWPRTFTVGIVLAIVGVLCLAMAAVVSTLRQRRSGTCGRVRSASQGLGPHSFRP